MSGESESNIARKLDEVTSAVATFSGTVNAQLKGQAEKVTDLEMAVYKGGSEGLGIEAELKFIQKEITESTARFAGEIESIKAARSKEKSAADKKYEDQHKQIMRIVYGAIGAAVIGLLSAGFNSFVTISAQGGTP